MTDEEEPKKSAASEAKDLAADLAGAAARGAVQGAGGGAAGAAVGAVKGAAIAAVQNKTARKIWITGLVAFVLVVVMYATWVLSTAGSFLSVVANFDDQNANASIENSKEDDEATEKASASIALSYVSMKIADAADAAEEDDAQAQETLEGTPQSLIDKAQSDAAFADAEWELTLAAQLEDENFEPREFMTQVQLIDVAQLIEDQELDGVGPDDARPLSLRTGAVRDGGQTAMYLPDNQRNQELAALAHAVYVAALTDTDNEGDGEGQHSYSFSKKEAENIFALASQWAYGAESPLTCTPKKGSGGSESGSDAGSSADTLNDAQIANVKVIIGIAMTMFPDDTERAAIIGLITARVESNFQIYANDGVVGPEDGSADTSTYALLARSLDVDHDAVGTDHSSLGMMQQQATAGWGNVGESTWPDDADGVIARLMDPSFNAAKFYSRMATLDWTEGEPGDVAQAVQVSALPDAYAKHVDLAEMLWDMYGDAPGLDVPEDIGWEDGGGNGGASGGSGGGGSYTTGCAGGTGKGGPNAPVEGDFTWPVPTLEDGSFSGYVGSDYGMRIHPNGSADFHEGLDFSGNPSGGPIYSIGAGTVTKSLLWNPASCGEYVEVSHPDGTSTGYLHLLTRSVAVGDSVEAGTYLGEQGGGQPGGCTFGPHLHFYVYPVPGLCGDPKPYLSARGLVVGADKYTSATINGDPNWADDPDLEPHACY